MIAFPNVFRLADARFFRILWSRYPRQCTLIVLCLLLAGIGEAISILSLLPLLGIVISGDGMQGTTVYQIVEAVLGVFGLEVGMLPLLGLMVVGALVKAALTMAAGRQVGYAAAQVGTDMRMGVIRSMIEAKWSHYASQPVGRLSNAVSSEANRASSAFLAGGQLAAGAVQVVIYLASAVMVSWLITALALAVGSIMVVALRNTVSHTRAAGREMTETLRALTTRFSDGLQGIKPLKAMAQKDNLLALLVAENETLHATQKKRVFNKWFLKAAQEPIIVVFLAAGFYAAFTFTDFEIEMLIVMAFLFTRTVNKIGAVQSHYQAMVSTESAFLALHDTIEQAESQREVMTSGSGPELRHGITFDHVSFSFGDRPVLHDVSIFIPAGMMTAIIGPSGSGKTTIVDLVAGLFRPDEGQIIFDGTPLDQLDLAGWRKRIGYVPQELFLFHADLITNVTLGNPDISEQVVVEALRAAGAWQFVSELPQGLYTLMGERGMRLSGGQRQRIAIARALARRPRLLILDEATTALDPKTEAAICSALKRFSGDMTILAISHQPALVGIADTVYRIADGEVQEQRRRQRAAN